jgi:hypothetical protein
MKLQLLKQTFTVCQLDSTTDADLSAPFTFLSRTDEEISLVCPTDHCPIGAKNRQDGWKCLRVVGVLDFSLIGILARIADCLAKAQVPLFAVSTYNTDYILVKEENYERALSVLAGAGYSVRG